MFEKITPEQAGISSKKVLKFLKVLDQYGLNTHAVIMARGDKIFAESYYAPFDKDFKHRLYSVSKSFVGVAIGLAIDDGLLSLDDKFIDFFPEAQNENLNDYLKDATIRDMLTMETSMQRGVNWFAKRPNDRVPVYFEKEADKNPGTYFEYDSSGSYMLGVIVEKLTGKPFLKYMQEKFLDDIGFSKDAYCIQAPGGYSFSDSGVVCTARDFLRFATFVKNKGEWNGRQYMSREYLEEAVSAQVSNINCGFLGGCHGYGYGYQIWKGPRNGFIFSGMGDQFAVCDPETDFVFIINSDNQGNPYGKTIMLHEIYSTIVDNLGEPMEEDPEALKELEDFISASKLMSLKETEYGDFARQINGITYHFDPKETAFKWIKVDIEGKKGVLTYETQWGVRQITFGIGYNEFGLFPEKGYSNMVATKIEEGHQYKCATSAEWLEERKLRIRCQVIDNYFGLCTFVLGFKGNEVTVHIIKYAEAFMNEYNVFATGRAQKA